MSQDSGWEIDESVFSVRHKHHRGHYTRQVWVFGDVNRESGQFVLRVVRNRRRVTLVPIIRRYIPQGCRIDSDTWAAYATLNIEGFRHLTVNHSRAFREPFVGACTNTIEGHWGVAKGDLRKYRGVKQNYLQDFLDVFAFRKIFSLNGGNPWEHFLSFFARFQADTFPDSFIVSCIHNI